MKQYYILLLTLCMVPLYTNAAESATGARSDGAAQAPMDSYQGVQCTRKDKLFYVGVLALGATAAGVGAYIKAQPVSADVFPPRPTSMGLGCGAIAMTNPGYSNTYVITFKPTCEVLNKTSPGIKGECPESLSLDFVEMRSSDCAKDKVHPCYSGEEVARILPKVCEDFVAQWEPSQMKPSPELSRDILSKQLTARIKAAEKTRKR